MTEFAWPWVLVLAPLPWLLRWWLRPAAPQQALHLPHPGLHLDAPERQGAAGWRTWLLVLAWLALLVAAARPQWVGPPQAQQRSGRALMLAVDLSGSMRTDDMQLSGQPVSRFGAVEAIAGDFIARRSGDEMGLILFGSRAFLVTPLTYDLHAVQAQLQGAAVGLAGTETAIGDAIGVAVKRLAGQPEQARVVVLLTDGVNNAGNIAPLDAAHAAQAAGVRIYTIGIGATEMNVPDLFGTHTVNPSADLDEGMLRSIATQTGGRYFRATDSNQLADAYRAIDALEPMPQQGPSLRPRHELFRWPLAVAVAAWLLAFVPRPRRREAFA
ncbi:Ca-activated chloride channel family protein [Dyella jiangningensis]|uniref:VWA domain-containing protein n=1 Tax=Dyella sp. AtDHG13 TaxID=1938897 RepID=UPI00088644E1|nr:VWA domain-containing protein [Dyella sp. AtDHG13]PXV59647.1 Ca-activated chloride channel family protein [Dyella sp. AtDHG13]SDJ28662.1 Ca-activated chloride channel family protein [Dyella jiangningensis]